MDDFFWDCRHNFKRRDKNLGFYSTHSSIVWTKDIVCPKAKVRSISLCTKTKTKTKVTTFLCIIKRIAHRKNIAPVAKSIDVVTRGLVKVGGWVRYIRVPKNHQNAWVFHLMSWSCRWRCDSASERNWTPHIADPYKHRYGTIFRNMMLEFSKTLNTTWHDHLLGCTGVLLSIHQSFPMLKLPFYLALNPSL